MGGMQTKVDDHKSDCKVWLSEAAIARIKGEDKLYKNLINKMELEYDSKLGLSQESFDHVTNSIEESIKAPNSTSFLSYVFPLRRGSAVGHES